MLFLWFCITMFMIIVYSISFIVYVVYLVFIYLGEKKKKKKRVVFTVTCPQKIGSVGRILSIYIYLF